MTTMAVVPDSVAPRTFRRTGTAAAGMVLFAVPAGLFVWTVIYPALEQTWADYAVGGAVFGAFGFLVFRVTVWPAVVVWPGAVVVRNPLVDHELTGGSPQLAPAVFGGIALVDGDVQVSVFALSSSLLDRLRGSRTTMRLRGVLEGREAGADPVVVRRDRLRVVRQAPAF